MQIEKWIRKLLRLRLKFFFHFETRTPKKQFRQIKTVLGQVTFGQVITKHNKSSTQLYIKLKITVCSILRRFERCVTWGVCQKWGAWMSWSSRELGTAKKHLPFQICVFSIFVQKRDTILIFIFIMCTLQFSGGNCNWYSVYQLVTIHNWNVFIRTAFFQISNL